MTSLVRGVRAMFAHVRTALMLWLVNVMLASVAVLPIWWWWSRTALLPETDPLLDRFHAGIFRTAGAWDVGVAPPWPARLAGAASLLLWIAVIACGRLLAYT